MASAAVAAVLLLLLLLLATATHSTSVLRTGATAQNALTAKADSRQVLGERDVFSDVVDWFDGAGDTIDEAWDDVEEWYKKANEDFDEFAYWGNDLYAELYGMAQEEKEKVQDAFDEC